MDFQRKCVSSLPFFNLNSFVHKQNVELFRRTNDSFFAVACLFIVVFVCLLAILLAQFGSCLLFTFICFYVAENWRQQIITAKICNKKLQMWPGASHLDFRKYFLHKCAIFFNWKICQIKTFITKTIKLSIARKRINYF